MRRSRPTSRSCGASSHCRTAKAAASSRRSTRPTPCRLRGTSSISIASTSSYGSPRSPSRLRAGATSRTPWRSRPARCWRTSPTATGRWTSAGATSDASSIPASLRPPRPWLDRDARSALAHAERAIGLEPLDERGYHAGLVALQTLGRDRDAIALYERACSAIAEAEAPPLSPALHALRDTIERREAINAAPRTRPLPRSAQGKTRSAPIRLLGRTAELD